MLKNLRSYYSEFIGQEMALASGFIERADAGA
jgi:hypothetical protein